jgi:hypothetical protein
LDIHTKEPDEEVEACNEEKRIPKQTTITQMPTQGIREDKKKAVLRANKREWAERTTNLTFL